MSMTREEAKEFFEDPYVNYETHGYYTEEEEIEANNWAISALSADVRPNIHGHWINETPHTDGCSIYTCSECGRSNLWESPFCPSCGADMREPPRGEMCVNCTNNGLIDTVCLYCTNHNKYEPKGEKGTT